jgi:hypothetical protein
MDQGFHANVPAAQYHSDPAPEPSLSSSIAKILLTESPLKAWHSHPLLNPAYRSEESGTFDLGTAAHAMLLEGEGNIFVCEFDDWRTKAAKEQRDEARAMGKTPLLARRAAAVKRMVGVAQAFIESSEIAELWPDADSEMTGIWQERDVWLRCRFDRITKYRRAIFDYKSTTDASPDGFSRQIVRMGYHLQDAFYRRGAQALSAASPKFIFLAQSVEPPHECTLHGCDPALQEIADAEIDRAVGLWRECITRDKWPSYGGRVHWAVPPVYLMSQHEQRLQEAA